MNRLKESLKKLVALMEDLRGPDRCPWDLVQTHASLKQYLVEEAYEVLDAIDSNDTEKLKEEFGDLFFQIIFHCQIAAENGDFDISDVVDVIYEKMIRRHPHVFAEGRLKKPEEVIAQWHKIKASEYANTNDDSVLAGVPKHLPSLQKALKVQKKASRVGFDWSKREDVFEKVEEEIRELKNSLISKDPDAINDEFGDLLFTIVNLSRFLELNPEESLQNSTNKFIKRFRAMEKESKVNQKAFESLSPEEMNVLWTKIKKTDES
ncbi:MAG: nucleoside triphosphate pyrophosphohydrolase [Candidatus Theseobacter exili]|nr:nucleoside triphosphate pyrophosphohydrolase [Candidatus Theseobacter exili]